MNNFIRVLVFALIYLTAIQALFAQSTSLDIEVSIPKGTHSLKKIMTHFKTAKKVTFAYSSSQINEELTLDIPYPKLSLKQFLYELRKQQILYKIKSNTIILFKKEKTIHISGYIEDYSSKERLIGANIHSPNSYRGTATNQFGFFSMVLNSDETVLIISYLGYTSQKIDLTELSDTILTIGLLPDSKQMEAIELTKTYTKQAFDLTSTIGTIGLSQTKLKMAPPALGEIDVLKVAQLMPGVAEGSEGNSGIYVRGGGQDQNLIILDGVTVYNPNHLFGFFSVFNADAIKDFKLYKGAFPARYGGRLSSVIDMSMREGNMSKIQGGVSIGLLSSKAYLEGPILNEKSSFFISARRTYIDLLASNLVSNVTSFDQSKYYFYDVNAKVNIKFSNQHRLYFSYYLGRDVGNSDDKTTKEAKLKTEEKTNMSWGNQVIASRWNWLIGSNLFMNTSVAYSRYDYLNDEAIKNSYSRNEQIEERSYSNKVETGINELSGGLDFSWYGLSDHHIRFGAKFSSTRFNTGLNSVKVISSNSVNTNSSEKEEINTKTLNLYLEDEIQLTSVFSTNLGAHYSHFYVGNTSYSLIEPRVSFKYQWSENLQFNAGGAIMQQYLQQLSFSRISLSSDIWVPATEQVKPARSKQLSLGTNYQIDRSWSLSLESYYKQMEQVLEYSETASFFKGKSWQERVEHGSGKSYGIEMLLEKTEGNLTGWLAYTLAESTRKFSNINQGKVFPFKYDRRHDFNIVINYQFNQNWSANAIWRYRTGNAETLGLIKYKNNSSFIGVSSDSDIVVQKRNNYRMPAYHRLDLSVNYRVTTANLEHEISLGVYNAYNRQNIYRISVRDMAVRAPQGGFLDTKSIQQRSLFGILPSIKYSLKF